jgi:hypothetical protein
LFVVSWMPYSVSIQIIFVCCAFFFLIFHLANISLAHFQGKQRKELHSKK